MHSKAHTHHDLPGLWRNPVNTTLTLMVAILLLIFLFLFLFIMEQPAQAQNSIPPTAVQAARMPQFAARLRHATPAWRGVARPKSVAEFHFTDITLPCD